MIRRPNIQLYDQKYNTLISTSSINRFTINQIFAKNYIEKNENVLYALQQQRGKKEITYTRIRVIETMRNIFSLPY